jgi:glycosyltransferase involved in cell wall biosynthesis
MEMTELKFPYPNIVKKLDQHYGLEGKASKYNMMNVINSFFKDITTRESPYNLNKPKKKLSILLTTFWDYPHTGGLSNYITTLRDGLRELGHHVDVVAPNNFPESKVNKIRKQISPEIKSFLTDRYGECSSHVLRSMRLLYIYESMLKKLDLRNYDILHAQDLFTANVLGRLNKRHGKPLIFTPHGMFTLNRVKFNRIDKGSVEEAYYEEMESKAIEYASHLIIISDSFIPELRSLGANKNKMTTIHTGIVFKPVREKPKKKKKKRKKKLIISCIARLGPRKGQADLLSALATLGDVTENVEVLIAGDGEMRESLEKQVKKLDLQYVNLLGKRDDVPQLLGKTDIFVLPTLNDSLPISIIEAMHSGKAIISTNCGGIPELINHNSTGILIEPGDVEELAKQLKNLILDDEKRTKLGKNAYEYAQENLTRESMVNRILSNYHKLLN